MRHILYLLPVAMLLAACTQDELSDNGQGTPLPEPIPLTLTAAIGDAVAIPTTRATTLDGQWPDGGTVYVQISETEAGLDNAEVLEYTVDADGKLTPPADAETIYWTHNDQKFYVRAWYPGGRTDYTDIPKADNVWTVGSDQSTEENLAKDDFLYAYKQLAYGSQPYTLVFKHLMSKITINIVNNDYLKQYDPAKVGVSLVSVHSDIGSEIWIMEGVFKGSGSNLALEEPVATQVTTSSITPCKLSSADGNYYASYEAIVIPQMINSVRGIQVKVGNAIYQWQKRFPNDLGYSYMQSGSEYTYNSPSRRKA